MSADDLPRLDRERIADALAEVDGARPRVVGVLLAGGTSSRFGERNKLLADLDGEPLVRHAARTLRDADLAAVIAVVGHEAEAVRAALDELDVRTVHNPDYGAGLSTSVARGVAAAADAGADAAVFLPGDLPRVDPATIRLLVDAHRTGLATALAAAHDGRRGNPVLFDATHFDALRGVEGDMGGRDVLLGAERGVLVETGDPGVLADVDRPDDLRRHR